ncbi:MAG TPA: N-acetyltransferase [Chloroflexota bacterium]|nr:N-acetyltransferase [Chloroflexota bacterium]
MADPGQVEIVRLSPNEWEGYRALRLRALQEEPQAFGETYANAAALPEARWRRRLVDAQSEEGWRLFFARLDGQLVGMIGSFPFQPKDQPPADPSTVRETWIISVFVASEARERGIGARLMEAMLADLSSSGRFDRVQLMVNVLQTAAIALYRRFGFEVTGEVDAVLGDGQTHSELVMWRELPWP